MSDYEKEIKALKKQVRILTKKLENSEADRIKLEHGNDQREALLKGLIDDLEISQNTIKQRSQELENALSNLKALQIKLIESEKMSALGVLVAGIAHEINNPINFINGNLKHATNYFEELLKLIELYETYSPETIAEIQEQKDLMDFDFIQEDIFKLLNSMKVGATRISQMVISLRTFSRLDESSIKPVNINEGIESTLLMLNNRLQDSKKNNNKGIEVIRNYGELPLFKCFASEINQVFMNILMNAIDALNVDTTKKSYNDEENKRTIWISTQVLKSKFIEIQISDNGIGMTEDEQIHVFEPFFTTKPVGQGTGLGMAIAHQIITEKHGGIISCESKIDKGTIFNLEIPISQI